MSSFRAPQTPGIDGLSNQFTAAEATQLQSVAALGTALYVLRVNAAGTGLEFASVGTGDALVANPLSQFAATTSLQLKGVISDETGSGALVFATSPTLVTPILGTPTSGTLTNCTGLPVNGIVDDTTSALGVGTIELGHASDTTLSRTGAGDIAIEGNTVYRAGGTDVPVTDGGTGTSTGAMTLVQGAARTIQIGSNTTGAGDQFTIAAGRALSGGTDLAGGILVLASGVSTGAGGSYISLQTSKAAASGTADNAVFQAAALNGNALSIYPHGTGAGNTYELRFVELAANGTNYVGFKGGDSIASSLIWTLPTADGGSNAVLKTDGSGTLAWTSTSTASLLGTIELGHASDTTISRVSAGLIAVEGVTLVDVSTAQTLTNKQMTTIELGHASDTTISRASAGILAVEGVNLVDVSAAQTLTNKTLTSPVLTTPSAFTTGGTITLAENTSIALDPAGSADGKYSGITVTGTAGYAQTYGDLVYLAVADSRWEKTDADDSATAGPVMLGMVVVAGAADGNACTLLLQGIIRADAAFPALTIGAPVYVGETAGAIQVAIPTGADNIIRVVGYALTADEIYFNPSMDHQVTVA